METAANNRIYNYLKVFWKRNRRILIMSVLVLIFSILYIYDTDTNTLTYDNPDTSGNAALISYASQNLNNSGITFTVNYAAWDLEKLGLRLYLDDNAGNGVIKVTVSDEDGVVDTQSCIYSAVVSNDLTWFTFNKDVDAGELRITVEAFGNNSAGVSVYTDGNNVDATETNLETHFVAVQYPKRNLYLMTCAMIFLVTVLFLIAKQRKWGYEKMFLLCGIVVGLLFFLILPALAEPDAGNHFRRVYAIIRGNILPSVDAQGDIGGYFSWPDNWSQGDSIQISEYQQLHDWIFQITDSGKTYISYKNMALYSPLCYLTTILGMLLGSLVTNQLLPIIFMAKLFNFICTGLVMYLAIRLTPFGKRYLVWISLLPMVMELSVGIAPDAMAMALISLLTAMVLRLRYTEIKVDKRYIFGLAVISFLLSQYKIVYVVFCLLLFLIPVQKFGNRKKYLIAASGIGGITAAGAFVWLHISSGILKSAYAESTSKAESCRHIFKFLTLLCRTLMEKGGDYIQQALGSNMGAMSFGTNTLIVFLLLILLCVSVGYERRSSVYQESVLHKDHKLQAMIVGVLLLASVLIFAAEYIQWTDAGSSVIDGVQGRYFLPMLFPLLILLAGRRKDDVPDYDRMYAFIAIDLCFLTQLMMHYLLLGAG